MTLSVCRDAPEDRVFVAATPAPDETYAGFTLDDIPAGRYWIRAGEAKLGPFQVSPGLCLDLGNLDRHRQPLGERPTVRRALAFVPDRGATGFGQLIVTVRTARGALLGSHSIRHVHGAWRLALELPLGEYQVSARAASGHFADYRLNIEDLELRAYAEQVQISR